MSHNPNEQPINDKEIKNPEGEEVPEDLDEFAAKIMRPARGSLSDLIASELAEAIHAGDPLQKIRHIIEASKLPDVEQQNKLVPEEKDRNEYSRFYNMALSLSYMPSVNVRLDYYTTAERTQVPFTFPEHEAYDHLLFYAQKFLWSFDDEDMGSFNKKVKEDYNDREAWNWYCKIVYRKFAYAQWDLQRCIQLKNAFVAHAMPKILVLLKLIFDAYVSPEVWQGIVGKKDVAKA